MTRLGTMDLTGRTINTLRAMELARISPLAYRCICTQCGAEGVYLHSRLVNGAATCQNGLACVRIGSERAAEQAERIRQQQDQEAEQHEAARAEQRRAAMQREAAEQNERINTQYARYLTCAVNRWKQAFDELIPLSTWKALGNAGRTRVLELVDRDGQDA